MADNWKRFLISGVIVAFFVLLPVVIEMGTDTMNLLVMLFIYIILAQSWNLMGGYTGLFNLGMAAFFGCGALTTHFLWAAGAHFYLAMLAGGIIAVVLAGIIGLPSLRLRGMYFAIGTLALAEALRLTVGNVFPRTIYMPSTYFVDFSLVPRYYLALAVAIIALMTVYIVANSRLGLALLATRDDEEAAQVTGVNIFKYKVIVFAISAFLAGLAGGVYTFYRLSLSPVAQFTPHWTFDPLMATCIGGAGTLTGPILGCVFFVIIQNWFALTLGKAHYIVLGILFILVILFLPGGMVEGVDRIRRFLTRLTGRKPEAKGELY
ncbi:MAG: branched-chain amino acid ABC transporter permease [Dehalococcoidia bacterium]|nr:branched-chain amino acid ABC transporter permease [Dehalococcoidia bacterium]